jgi:O-succinylbenzoic acid--CoA ligase
MSIAMDIPQEFQFSCSSDFIFLHAASVEHPSIRYSDIALYSQKLPNWLEAHQDEPHTYILQSNNSAELCCLVAGLFLSGIPFCIVDPTWTNSQVHEATQEIPFTSFLNGRDISVLHTQWLSLIPSQKQTTHELSLIVNKTPFAFLFTSGSSSRPKRIPLRHYQLWAAYQATQAQVQLSPNQSWGLCLPLHHIGALSIVLKSLLSLSSISLSSSSDVQHWNSWLNGWHHCRVISMVPTQLHKWLEHNRTENISPLVSEMFRFIILGGGPTNAPDINEAANLEWPILLSYGMTETFAHICSIPASELPKPLKEPLPVGQMHPAQSIELRYEEDTNDPIIWLMGTQIFTPEPSQNRLLKSFDEQGWFCTGDIGKVDEKGLLYIQARRLDRIVSGGENIAVDWVIDCLKQHPSIQDCAIIGVADPKWGQKVVAFIVPISTVSSSVTPPVVTSKSVSAQAVSIQKELHSILLDDKKELQTKLTEELLDQCRRLSLPASHLPKEFLYLNSLPRTSLGKLNVPSLRSLCALTRGK